VVSRGGGFKAGGRPPPYRGQKVGKTQGKAMAGLRSVSPSRAGVHPAFWPFTEI